MFRLHLSRLQVVELCAYSVFLALTAVLLWGGFVECLSVSFDDGSLAVGLFSDWVAFPLTLLLLGVLSYRKGDLSARRMSIAAFALILAGGFGVFSARMAQTLASPLFAFIGLSFGSGCAFLFMLFQRLLAASDLFSTGIIVMAAAILSPLVHLLLMAFSPQVQMGISVLILVPLVLILIGWSCSRSDFSSAAFMGAPRDDPGARKAAMHDLAQPFLCIALTALVNGIMQSLTVGDQNVALTNGIKMIGLLLSGIVLLIAWRRLFPTFSLGAVYQVVFPLSATAYLLLPFLGSSISGYVIAFCYLIFAIASALMVITCVEVSQARRLSPTYVYGFFAGGVYLSSSAGAVLGQVFRLTGNFGAMQLLVIALIAIYILFIVMFIARHRQHDGSTDASSVPLTDEQGNEYETYAKTDAYATSSPDIAEPVADGSSAESNIPSKVIARCRQLQERYGLSDREVDVAELLACGRDVPYIARSLFISENTVRTHTKNFYRKTDVHTKQEFLNLLDTMDGAGKTS